ncbi:MAG TPA: polysaccharide deacetylase family protein [Armatimonadota bacterium]|nr:polysaccharide deacetylase family protein [Armatimonadota bacterium]
MMDNGRRGNSRGRRTRRRSLWGGVVYVTLLCLALAAGAWLGVDVRTNPHRQRININALIHRRISLHPAPKPAAPRPPAPAPPVLLTEGTGAIPVIMYHDVVPSKLVWFDMTTPEFARQMDDLSAAGAHPITLDELYAHLLSNKPVPDRSIVLTFDDCTLGQFTYALPILEQHHFPATFFVQTGYVGKTTGKRHMTWDDLRAAEKTGLITVESHTITHPEDLTKLSDAALKREFTVSKTVLEQKLGHPILFLAYPSGNCDSRVAEAARNAGYLAAVTMDRGWTACPAQSYYLPRFAPPRVADVIAAWTQNGPVEPPLPRLISVLDATLEMGTFTGGNTPVEWLAGGDLTTETLHTRKTVGEMALAVGAQAALNGTFFADARVQSNGSAMVGPTLSSIGSVYEPVTPSDEKRIVGRPLVMFGDHRCLILPYEPHLGGSLEDLKFLMPDVKDAFLAGGWVVHYGAALSRDEIAAWSSNDANDPRHRAVVGVDGLGRYLLAATQESVSTREVATALQAMGVQEAFLLDSGFSTSLIWQNHVLVSGHARKDVPSRPVPHALFLMGKVAPDAPPAPPDSPIAAGAGGATLNDAFSADSTAGAAHYHSRRRRRRRS